MKEIKLYLIRKYLGYGDFGEWKLVMINCDKNINEELAKKFNIQLTEEDKKLDISLNDKVSNRFDYKEVDLKRLEIFCN